MVSADAAVGAPRDETGHLRKVGRLKLHKAFAFMSRRSTSWKTLVWVAVCSCIMVVHYKLFKYGTWHSHRRADDRYAVFDFCRGTATNPVAAALTTLSGILLDPEGQGRGPLAALAFRFGPSVPRWPRKVVEDLQVAVLLAFSVLWRKLFHFFQCYPWKLAPSFDARLEDHERSECFNSFLQAPVCCLDRGLGLRVRALLESEGRGRLLDRFMEALFECTPTQVELVFASLSRLTLANDRGAGLPTIAAKGHAGTVRPSCPALAPQGAPPGPPRSGPPPGGREPACVDVPHARWPQNDTLAFVHARVWQLYEHG